MEPRAVYCTRPPLTRQYRAPTLESQTFLTTLGRRLRDARTRAGLTVQALADRSGVSRRHVLEAEAGRANLSVLKLRDLARALDADPGSLLSERGARSGRIALLGLRGAGKSTVGRALALEIEAPFVELDRRVEELAGLPLASIFDLHGAEGYRRLEAEALERVLAEGERLVLATGGSIVQSPATFARLRQTCRTVWLAAAPEVHYERVLAQGDRRPMAGRPRALEELKALLAEREPLYARCEIRVDTNELAPERVVATLAQRLA